LHFISLFCAGEIALIIDLRLSGLFSANQTAETVACILLPAVTVTVVRVKKNPDRPKNHCSIRYRALLEKIKLNTWLYLSSQRKKAKVFEVSVGPDCWGRARFIRCEFDFMQ